MPLTEKGETILAAMKKKYGEKRGEKVFYASRNAGTITGVDSDNCPTCDGRKELSRGLVCPTCSGTGNAAPNYQTGSIGEPDATSDADSFCYVRDNVMFEPVKIDDGAQVRYTSDGYLTAAPRICRTGIQLYRGSELGKPDMSVVRVYRPVDEVFKTDAIHSYAHKPLTNDHPPERVTAANWKKYSIGYTGDEVMRDGHTARVPIMMADAAAIEQFKSGKSQLSVGYDCDLDWTPGVITDRKDPDFGKTYDCAQRNIRANHLAFVTAARGGSSLSIGDGNNTGDDDMNLKTLTVDGISCQMVDVAADIVNRALADRDGKITALEKVVADAKSDKDADDKKKKEQMEKDAATIATLQAENATLKTQLDSAKVTPQQLDAMVKDRAEVAGKARTLIGDALVVDGKTVEDIRAQVVHAKIGDAAKSWTPEQIKVSFDTLTANVKSTAVSDAARVFSTGHQGGTVNTNDAEAAYGEYLKTLNNGWMGKTATN